MMDGRTQAWMRDRVEHLSQLRKAGPVDLGPEDSETDQDVLFRELADLEKALEADAEEHAAYRRALEADAESASSEELDAAWSVLDRLETEKEAEEARAKLAQRALDGELDHTVAHIESFYRYTVESEYMDTGDAWNVLMVAYRALTGRVKKRGGPRERLQAVLWELIDEVYVAPHQYGMTAPDVDALVTHLREAAKVLSPDTGRVIG